MDTQDKTMNSLPLERSVGGSRVAPVGRIHGTRGTQQVAGTDRTGWYGNNFEV